MNKNKKESVQKDDVTIRLRRATVRRLKSHVVKTGTTMKAHLDEYSKTLPR